MKFIRDDFSLDFPLSLKTDIFHSLPYSDFKDSALSQRFLNIQANFKARSSYRFYFSLVSNAKYSARDSFKRLAGAMVSMPKFWWEIRKIFYVWILIMRRIISTSMPHIIKVRSRLKYCNLVKVTFSTYFEKIQ